MELAAELICAELELDEMAFEDETRLEFETAAELGEVRLLLLPPPPQANSIRHPHTNSARHCQMDTGGAALILFFSPIWLTSYKCLI